MSVSTESIFLIWALAVLGALNTSESARTNEKTVAFAREAFFAYRTPLDTQTLTRDYVSYQSSDFVQTFAGSVRLTIHNVTDFLSIANKPAITAFVAVSAAFNLTSTREVLGLPDLVFEEAFELPRSKIPDVDDGVITLSVITNNVNEAVADLGVGPLPVLPATLATTTLNITALNLVPGVQVPVQLNASDAGGLINLSLEYQDAVIPEAHSAAVTARNNSDVWDALMQRVDVTRVYDNLTRVAFIDAFSTNTQLWISQNATAKQVVVAFRGSDNISDFATSFRASDVPFLEEDIGKTATPTTALVHDGFFRSWQSVQQQVLAIVAACAGTDHAAWDVTVTGHSLGAAMATLGAFFIGSYKGGGWYNSTSMYNYGSPRVGNTNFASRYEQLLPETWRHFNGGDKVTQLPPRLQANYTEFGLNIASDYHHVFPALNLSMNGSDTVLAVGTEEPYSDPAQLTILLLQFTARFTNVSVPVTPATDPDGDGVASGVFEFHFEGQYLKSITALVNQGGNVTNVPAPPAAGDPANGCMGTAARNLLVLAAVALLVTRL